MSKPLEHLAAFYESKLQRDSVRMLMSRFGSDLFGLLTKYEMNAERAINDNRSSSRTLRGIEMDGIIHLQASLLYIFEVKLFLYILEVICAQQPVLT